MRRLPAAQATARQKHDAMAATSSSVGMGPVSSPPNSRRLVRAQGVAAAADVALARPPLHSAVQTAYSWRVVRRSCGPPAIRA